MRVCIYDAVAAGSYTIFATLLPVKAKCCRIILFLRIIGAHTCENGNRRITRKIAHSYIFVANDLTRVGGWLQFQSIYPRSDSHWEFPNHYSSDLSADINKHGTSQCTCLWMWCTYKFNTVSACDKKEKNRPGMDTMYI